LEVLERETERPEAEYPKSESDVIIIHVERYICI